ncbi:alpha/beta hydrolase [Limibacillus halophilus]|uniref:Pimeloyl-ACP methyl ester carboxylesterase n=1 Tax=Limibacillus halophilus TaxID=1579333 RepID=A0A839SNN2_9PROT|nr:alpha/beta fold hydrolase [Limibacillus halophilus]MBB3063788.1 pimeloyl-ACP methyl ester carboxylesterase [Limibacillus halophilus]
MTQSSNPASNQVSYLACPNDARIAYHRLQGKGPGIVFLGGFASDMTGTKALALEAFARDRGQAFLRFDYQGHGASSGRFEDGSIGLWAEDAKAAIAALTQGPQILVGSSMGGWIMLLAALAMPERVAALVGIAPAPDFTEDLMWAGFTAEVRTQIMETGAYREPSDYSDEPYVITRKLIEDGRQNLLLRDPIPLSCPVRILQGLEDRDVPWEHALKLCAALESSDVEVTLVKGGDHRLSEPADLDRLAMTLERLLERF